MSAGGQRMMTPVYVDEVDALRDIVTASKELLGLGFDNPHAIGRATLALNAAVLSYEKTRNQNNTTPRKGSKA